jgi:hypothetical protein
MSKDRNLINVGGLWVEKGQKGEYLTGKAGNIRYFVFKNRNPKSENSPQYFLAMGEAEKPQQETREPGEDRDEDTFGGFGG